jgi:meiotic recombination protein SPO11
MWLTPKFRNIYYQNPDLFKSQSAVDEMVDNLAFTLGVCREDLNIVRGLVSACYSSAVHG